MKKNIIAGFIVSLAMTGLIGSVAIAEDNQPADTKQVATTEAKADAPPAPEKTDAKTDECCTMGELKPL
jgi:hypothetical protein